jgi:putative Holliday junction resolvase
MGLAIGNDRTGTASPLEVVPYEGVPAAARRIADTAERLGADRIVLGLPTLADGSVGPAARRSEQLAEELARLGLDAVLQGEFLSTDEARRRARAAGRPPRQAVDDLAAQVILEEYLADLENRQQESGQ